MIAKSVRDCDQIHIEITSSSLVLHQSSSHLFALLVQSASLSAGNPFSDLSPHILYDLYPAMNCTVFPEMLSGEYRFPWLWLIASLLKHDLRMDSAIDHGSPLVRGILVN